jgi:serine/threonine-protein kinase
MSFAGRFELLERLGYGSSAEVWLARRGSTLCALKLLAPHLLDDGAARQRFLRGARLAAALEHEHLARVLDQGEAEGRPYAALEWVNGPTLAQLESLDFPRIVALVRGLALGVDHLHRRAGVTHGDLTPDNAAVNEHGVVKLLDFGLLAPTGRRPLGTLAYAAPETIQGRAADGRADVFSLGVLLFELLSGQRLFRRSGDAATLLAVVEAPIPAPSSLRAGLPIALDQIVARALERDRERRFESAAALADALDRYR